MQVAAPAIVRRFGECLRQKAFDQSLSNSRLKRASSFSLTESMFHSGKKFFKKLTLVLARLCVINFTRQSSSTTAWAPIESHEFRSARLVLILAIAVFRWVGLPI